MVKIINMTTVVNIPRKEAEDWSHYIDPDKAIWIAIGEPHLKYIETRNEFLDELPNLHISFWDIVTPVPIIGTDEWAEPPTKEQAKEIVDFILKHKGKNVIVNCKKGVSRSSAIALFCRDMLNYKWLEEGEKRAVPNHLLYTLMRKYYLSFNEEPVKVIDKRNRKCQVPPPGWECTREAGHNGPCAARNQFNL